jgi:septal ring factor EnvC (AmiA/AmiB activator)
MSKRLEDFIRANREEFDDLEPRAGLWAEIEKKLPEEPKKREAKTFSIGFVLRVAATVILVMGVSFVIFLKSIEKKDVDLAQINPEYAKQQVHYASLVETKRTELKQIAKSDPALYQEFSKEIAQMDSTYKKLNSDLANSPNQELVLRAMIQNLQIQTEVLNQQLSAIEQYNQDKKDQKNETKNI